MSTSSRHKITVMCPFCKTRVRIEDLPGHKRTHQAQETKRREDPPIRPGPENAQKAKPAANSENGMSLPTARLTSCPICTVRVKTARLKKHLEKVHPNTRFPHQPPRVQEVKVPVRNNNLAEKKSERTVSSHPAQRPVVHRSGKEPETRQLPNVNTPTSMSAGQIKHRSAKSKKAKQKKVNRTPRASSRRWNISKAISSERRYKNEDFVKPTSSPNYIVRKSYFDHVRVSEEELDRCPHGVSRFRICAICDPDKFREMTGID